MLPEDRAVLVFAKNFCDMYIGPEHNPYDSQSVQIMLSFGMRLERVVAPNHQIADKIHEAVGYWKSAITEFPLPRRYAPAVTWAFGE